MTNTAPKTTYLKNYTTPDYLVENTFLTFEIFDGHTIVTQKSNYVRQTKKQVDLVLNGGNDVELLSVSINGKNIKKYTHKNETLILPKPGEIFALEIVTKIVPERNTTLEGLYKSGDMYCTQCEAEGFRHITFWQDRPDVMTTFTVRIEADKTSYPILLSNGNCIETGDIDGGRHYAVWEDPHKKPSYLFALVSGDLVHKEDHFKTISGRKVTLKIFTRPDDINQIDFAMQALKDSMKWDEEAYGREYDLDIFNIVAVGDFNMGAMENKSLNIFNTALVLAQPETATDQDFLRIERVIGHEYFHNWSGNRVTCRDWFQLSLKEGFTVYRENQFGQAMNNPICERIDEVTLLRDLQFTEDAGPMAHPIRPESYIEINNFYTMTVYEKGGEVIRMLNILLGDELYRKGCDLYFARHDGDAATCDDFIACMEDVSAKDLSQFKLWYSQAGTPRVKAKSSYDGKKKQVTITFEQSIPDTAGQNNKKPMVIPIKTGLIGADGNDIDKSTLILTKDKQSFTFEGIDEKPIISYLRGFSAPVIMETDHNENDLLFILRHDLDGFNRWEAGQRLMIQAIERKMNNINEGLSHRCLDVFFDLSCDLCQSDKALLVRLLTLPGESTIANTQKTIDPDAIFEARNSVHKQIASALNDRLDDLYTQCAPDATFSTTPQAMAKRALRNIVLSYLYDQNESKAVRLAYEQYQNAKTMTERLGALQILMKTDRPEREWAVADYYDRFHHHDLAIDKWFSLQATSQRQDTPARIKSLMNHPDFTLLNPNRVRSLIGAFAMRNQRDFHVLSGEGYKILTDVILELDNKNPQIASRLMTPLRQWKSFTSDRQKLIKAELKRILAKDDLSPNVFEIVSKCLKG